MTGWVSGIGRLAVCCARWTFVAPAALRVWATWSPVMPTTLGIVIRSSTPEDAGSPFALLPPPVERSTPLPMTASTPNRTATATTMPSAIAVQFRLGFCGGGFGRCWTLACSHCC